MVDAMVRDGRFRWSMEDRVMLAADGQKQPLAWRAGTSESGKTDVLLLKPLGYMNRSGPGVAAAMAHWNVSAAELLVVCDDVSLETGRLRFRASGSSGGQNGLESVMNAIQTDQFARLRVGIGPKTEGVDLVDFVLRKMNEEEWKNFELCLRRGAEAAICWVENGLERAMNQYNSTKDKEKE